MKTPIDFFFKLGEKATKNNPYAQQDFTYYMLWIIFLSFSSLFFVNLYHFFTGGFHAEDAIWSLVGFAIASLQYFSLKQLYDLRKLRLSKGVPKEEDELSVEEMEKLFK